jgi:hypothetical protein
LDLFEFVCYLGAFAIILTLFFIVPMVGAVLLSVFIADLTGITGLSWWIVVITVYLIITSILYHQSKN